MRACLLSQLFLRLVIHVGRLAALVLACLAVASVAVLLHLPKLVHEEGLGGSELAEALFHIGNFALAMSALFLAARNLFVCVGLHAIWNARATVVRTDWVSADGAWWMCTCLIILGFMLAKRPSASPGTL